MIRVLIPVADGSEEIETVCIADTLVRAGAKITLASVRDISVTASRGIKLTADKVLSDCLDDEYDAIIIPGGIPGAEYIGNHQGFVEMLRKHYGEGKLVGAICAAPAVVLKKNDILRTQKATCHPNFSDHLINQDYVKERVVVDDNLITSQAPGTAIEFALAVVEALFGKEKAQEVEAPMVVNRS